MCLKEDLLNRGDGAAVERRGAFRSPVGSQNISGRAREVSSVLACGLGIAVTFTGRGSMEVGRLELGLGPRPSGLCPSLCHS